MFPLLKCFSIEISTCTIASCFKFAPLIKKIISHQIFMLAAGGWGWLVVNGKGRCQSCQASSHASCQITSYKPAFSLENCAWYFTVFLSVGKVQLYLVNNSKLPDTHWARSQHRPAQHCMRSTHWLSTGEIGACMRGQCNSCKSIAWFCSVCWRLKSEKWM